MACGLCGKKTGLTIAVAAAPPVSKMLEKPSSQLQSQCDAEGRGQIAGELELCIKCWRDGATKPKTEAA